MLKAPNSWQILPAQVSKLFKASDKTVITLKDLTEAITERSCSCTKNADILKKSDEHLRLLLKISSVRIVSTLQNLAHHVNGLYSALMCFVLVELASPNI